MIFLLIGFIRVSMTAYRYKGSELRTQIIYRYKRTSRRKALYTYVKNQEHNFTGHNTGQIQITKQQ